MADGRSPSNSLNAMSPSSHEDQRVYGSRRRQLLLAAALVGIFLATVSLVFEPDPTTGMKPLPSDYLWLVIPGAIMVGVLSWRAMKARVVTDARGVDVIRVVGHEFVPWSRLRGFEVHPTPSQQGAVVLARLADECLVKIRSEIMLRPVRDRAEARRLARGRAEILRRELDADRRDRQRASVANDH